MLVKDINLELVECSKRKLTNWRKYIIIIQAWLEFQARVRLERVCLIDRAEFCGAADAD